VERFPFIDKEEVGDLISGDFDLVALGRWIRHHRKSQGLTLDQLAAMVDASPSHLSLIEGGRREARVALLSQIAKSLNVSVSTLMNPQTVDKRTELVISLEHAQRSDLYASLALQKVRTGPSLPNDALEALVGLHQELVRRSSIAAATPEEARKANSQLRIAMRKRNNYYKEIELEATRILTAVKHQEGPLGERRIRQIAEHLGFELVYVPNLPHSTRSLTDLKNHKIFLPDTGWGDHDPRTIILQALGHQVLQHQPPTNFADFLRQRVEVNYFAAALLISESSAVPLLERAKQGRYIAIEDLRDAFSVSYETAAHRFTNLATEHLGLQVHFLRVHETGTIYKAYENDNLLLPADSLGSIEGQVACRSWAARTCFSEGTPGATYWQYTDTPSGTYWSCAQSERTSSGSYSISVGVKFADTKWFRGRETKNRSKSTCPDPKCCREPLASLQEKWAGFAWPSAHAHSHLLAALPPGTFPGVDSTEVYEFLEGISKK